MVTSPRVLIGCPTYDGMKYCLDEWANAVRALTYKNMSVVLADNSESDEYRKLLEGKGFRVVRTPRSQDALDTITEGRNQLRELALKEGFDYFFSLEQDVIPPADAIERLLACDASIISGIYCTVVAKDGHADVLPLLWTWVSQEEYDHILANSEMYPETYAKVKQVKPSDLKRQLTMNEVELEDFFEVKYAGLGCMLIRRDVLEKVRFARSKGERGTDDIGFCDAARATGFKIVADARVRCDHLKQRGKISRFV